MYTKIASTEVTSSVASVYLTGIATNDPHLIMIANVAPSTDNVSLYGTVTKSGSEDTSSNYDQTYKNMYDQTYGISNSHNANESFMNMGNCGTGTSETHNAFFWLYNFADTGLASSLTRTTMNISSDQKLYGQIGATAHTVSSASDGIRFYFSGGLIASGTFVMWKVT